MPRPSRGRERCDAPIAVALIVGRRAPEAATRQRLEAAEVVVEAQVEIDPLHLAVGDPVEPGAELVVDGQPNGVADAPPRGRPARTARDALSRRR